MWYKNTGKMLNYAGQPPFTTFFYVRENTAVDRINYYEFLSIEGRDTEFLGLQNGPIQYLNQWEKCEPHPEILRMFEEVRGE